MAFVCRGFTQKNPDSKIREVLAGHDMSDDLADMAATFWAPRKIVVPPWESLLAYEKLFYN